MIHGTTQIMTQDQDHMRSLQDASTVMLISSSIDKEVPYMIKKIVARIGVLIFLLGVMSADSPNLLWPLGMAFGGLLLIKLAGGQESL